MLSSVFRAPGVTKCPFRAWRQTRRNCREAVLKETLIQGTKLWRFFETARRYLVQGIPTLPSFQASRYESFRNRDFQRDHWVVVNQVGETECVPRFLNPDEIRDTGRRVRFFFRVMMTSSNGNIFRVTGPLYGEFTGPGEFPTQRPVTRSFDVYFDQGLNKRLCKQS